MEKLNELIDFYEMTGDEPELLVMLIELRRHRQDNWKQLAEAAVAKLAELAKQEPVGWMTDVEVDELHRGIADEAYIYRRADATSTIPLFTRPSQND